MNQDKIDLTEEAVEQTKEIDVSDVPRYFLPERAYLLLKWLGLIALPAVAAFSAAVLPAVGVEQVVADAVSKVASGLGVLVGALIGASELTSRA